MVDMSSETVFAVFRCMLWTIHPPTPPTVSSRRLMRMLGAAMRTVRRMLMQAPLQLIIREPHALLTPEYLATAGTCFESEIQNAGIPGMSGAE